MFGTMVTNIRSNQRYSIKNEEAEMLLNSGSDIRIIAPRLLAMQGALDTKCRLLEGQYGFQIRKDFSEIVKRRKLKSQ